MRIIAPPAWGVTGNIRKLSDVDTSGLFRRVAEDLGRGLIYRSNKGLVSEYSAAIAEVAKDGLAIGPPQRYGVIGCVMRYGVMAPSGGCVMRYALCVMRYGRTAIVRYAL